MGINAKWFLNTQIEQGTFNELPMDVREMFTVTKVYRRDIDYSKYDGYEPKPKEEIKKDKEREEFKRKINNLKENE